MNSKKYKDVLYEVRDDHGSSRYDPLQRRAFQR